MTVFGRADGTKIMSIKTAWKLACRRAGIKGLRFQDLRREAGSTLKESRMPEHYVQRVLGHANIKTTSTYLAGTDAGLEEYFSRYDRSEANDDDCSNDSDGGAEQISRARSLSFRQPQPHERRSDTDPAVGGIGAAGKRAVSSRQSDGEADETSRADERDEWRRSTPKPNPKREAARDFKKRGRHEHEHIRAHDSSNIAARNSLRACRAGQIYGDRAVVRFDGNDQA